MIYAEYRQSEVPSVAGKLGAGSERFSGGMRARPGRRAGPFNEQRRAQKATWQLEEEIRTLVAAGTGKTAERE